MKFKGSSLSPFATLPVATLPLVALLTATVARGDILTDTSPFLRSANPTYTAEGLDASAGLVDAQYAPFSPADSDLGVQEILGTTPDRAPINVMFGVDLQYTDNAPAVVTGFEEPSSLISTYLGVSWQPHLGSGWFADIGFAQEFYEFDDSAALDFENSLPYIGVVKNIVALDDTIFFARYEYQRLTSGTFSNGDYHAQRIRTGLQKTLFATARQQLAGGITAVFDIDAGPENLERNEYAADLTYTYAFTSKLTASALWRSAIWDFDQAGREDTVHTGGVELSYNLCTNSTVSAGVYFSTSDSNTGFGINDVDSWQGGLSFGLNYSF